ncbi:hypothetical protein BS50DRAFT_280296 [Corynespora cassiicola Philippines]|uniref:Uncharacterized protein n=1 Tax=Corynespora cassiicola Philippines TaxID=1448308 RepID=A0A2T2P0Z0_CORCC|nr:hypothetical protein BS50DRAFT_280296 [Corynespora cassiicola Philippines]
MENPTNGTELHDAADYHAGLRVAGYVFSIMAVVVVGLAFVCGILWMLMKFLGVSWGLNWSILGCKPKQRPPLPSWASQLQSRNQPEPEPEKEQSFLQRHLQTIRSWNKPSLPQTALQIVPQTVPMSELVVPERPPPVYREDQSTHRGLLNDPRYFPRKGVDS